MGIKTFGFDKAIADAKRQESGIDDEVMLRRLQYLGEYLLNHYKTVTPDHSSGGYDDQSGNLRHSCGFRIYKDGELKDESIPLEGFTSMKADVQAVTEPQIQSALDKFVAASDASDGWYIVLVTERDYAKYVQAKGYNVMHLTAIEMERKVAELKKELGLS